MMRRLGTPLIGLVAMATMAMASGCSDDTASPDSALVDAGISLDQQSKDSAGTGTDTGAGHPPITIIATNQTGNPVYVDWKWGPRGILSCGLKNNGSWDTCSFFSPGCMEPCSADNKGVHCCMGCAPPMDSVKKLDLNDSVSTTWSGEDWKMVQDHCADSCACYWVVQAPTGSYRVEICVHDAYSCGSTICPDPDQNGVVVSATPSGTKTCYTTEFQLPNAGTTVEVTIE
jgi:hypothetical protein